nr:reverse transcriptase domain-containing protein [Tanacetum cinerariifolium]
MTVIIMTVVPVTTLLSGRLMSITTLLPLVWSLSAIIIPHMEDLIIASSIGNLSHIRKRNTHEVVKGRLAKTLLEVLCLLLRSTSSCSEEPSKSEETLHKLRTSLSIRLANRGLPHAGLIPQNADLDLRMMEELCQPTMLGQGGPIAPMTIRRDTINAAAGGTFMKRRPKECYALIKNLTAHHNDWDTSAQRGESSRSITSSSSEIAVLTHKLPK